MTSQTQLFSVTRELLVPSALSSPEVALSNVIPEVNLRSEPEKIYFPATNLLTSRDTKKNGGIFPAENTYNISNIHIVSVPVLPRL